MDNGANEGKIDCTGLVVCVVRPPSLYTVPVRWDALLLGEVGV